MRGGCKHVRVHGLEDALSRAATPEAPVHQLCAAAAM